MLDDEQVLQEVGIYRYHHPLEHAEEHKQQLRALDREVGAMARAGSAALASDMFTFRVREIELTAAVTVEADLLRAFAERRVNHVNRRREFFFAAPDEVRTVLLEQVGNLLEFAEHPESTQYVQSKEYWPARGTGRGEAAWQTEHDEERGGPVWQPESPGAVARRVAVCAPDRPAWGETRARL